MFMVVRIVRRARKYLGTRRWGGGNIKNRRGSGSRGGVGKGGKKSKFTYTVKYDKERIHTPGFVPPRREILMEINLDRLSNMAAAATGEKPTIELRGYKVLSDGRLDRAVVVKATNFSKKAEEKIKLAGGDAVKLQ
jgi:large subunit ribosomal protein L15